MPHYERSAPPSPVYTGSSIFAQLFTAASAACFADALTFPLDTVKVRLQVQGESEGLLLRVSLLYEEAVISQIAPKYTNIAQAMKSIVVEESVRGLFKGLVPGLQRQMAFSAIKLGMYDTFKSFYHRLLRRENDDYVNIPTRILAGMTTGGLAVMCAQPTDVVKVRMQAQGQKRYRGSLHAYAMIWKEEGVGGLWKGCVPNVVRNAIVNVAETVCYDVTKDTLLYYDVLRNGIPLHFVSASSAGLCATVIASPVDVIKTRYMNSKPGEYRNALDAAARMFMQEGPAAFYKGFLPSFFRLVSWNICMWMTYEQIKEKLRQYNYSRK